jgi:TRAP transporter TAXI family solute receptor
MRRNYLPSIRQGRFRKFVKKRRIKLKRRARIMKRVYCLLVLCLALFVINNAQATSMPRLLRMITSPIGTGAYGMATGLASILSVHLPTEVKVVPTTGPREAFPMFLMEEAELGAFTGWDCMENWLAGPSTKEYLKAKGAPVRLLTGGSPNQNAAVTAADSGIRTGKDVKGKRYVGIFAGSPSITLQAHAALANFGLKPSDVRMISVPGVAAGVKAVIEGRADATGSAVLGMAEVKELDGTKGARFISFDPSPQAVKRYTDIFPASLIKIEAGKGTEGIREPIYMMEYDFYLISHQGLYNEAAYQIVKTLWDYNKELTAISARLSKWTTDRFVTKNPLIPYHPGAIKFYKEKGLWSSEMDKKQQELLKQEK